MDTERMEKKAKQTADRVGAKASSKLRQTARFVDEQMNGGTVENIAEQAGQKLREWQDSAEDTLSDGRAYAESKVKANPLISVGAAFVAGAVISRLFGNRG